MKSIGLLVSITIALVATSAVAEPSVQPAEHYARDSFGLSLTTGISDTMVLGRTNSSNVSTLGGFQFNGQMVHNSLLIGTGFQVLYNRDLRVDPALLANTLTLGVVIPRNEVAMTVKVNGGVMYSPGGSMSAMESLGGSLAVCYFVRPDAYIGLDSSGAWGHLNNPSQDYLILGFSYTLGIVW